MIKKIGLCILFANTLLQGMHLKYFSMTQKILTYKALYFKKSILVHKKRFYHGYLSQDEKDKRWAYQKLNQKLIDLIKSNNLEEIKNILKPDIDINILTNAMQATEDFKSNKDVIEFIANAYRAKRRELLRKTLEEE